MREPNLLPTLRPGSLRHWQQRLATLQGKYKERYSLDVRRRQIIRSSENIRRNFRCVQVANRSVPLLPHARRPPGPATWDVRFRAAVHFPDAPSRRSLVFCACCMLRTATHRPLCAAQRNKYSARRLVVLLCHVHME